MSALHRLEEVGGNLCVTDNISLAALDAEALLDAIESVGGVIEVRDNGP